MSRIRTIKPEFFRHEELFDAEQESGLPLRIAFAALWTIADREGRFKWRPRSLKSECLPFDDCDFSRVLDALCTRGFCVRYRVADGNKSHDFGAITNWKKHQFINPRELPSSLPSPEEGELIQYDDACSTQIDACHVRNIPVCAEREEEREEERYREGKGLDSSLRSESCRSASPKPPARTNGALRLPPAVLSNFERFWESWPHKVGKGAARKAFETAAKKASLEEILDAIDRYVAVKPKDRPWCNPATWLNQERWLDDEATPPRKTVFDLYRERKANGQTESFNDVVCDVRPGESDGAARSVFDSIFGPRR